MISAMTWLKTIHVLQPWALMFSVCSEESFIITCFKSISAAIFNTCELVCLLLYVFKCPHVHNLFRTVQPANIKPCRLNILYQMPGIGGVCMCISICLKTRGMYTSLKFLNLMKLSRTCTTYISHQRYIIIMRQIIFA